MEKYLHTTPGTILELSVPGRRHPCWRCRLHLRWPPNRKHWQCRPAPRPLRYVDAGR